MPPLAHPVPRPFERAARCLTRANGVGRCSDSFTVTVREPLRGVLSGGTRRCRTPSRPGRARGSREMTDDCWTCASSVPLRATYSGSASRAWWRRLLRSALVMAALAVVFGWLLPQFIDYEEVWAALAELDGWEVVVLVALGLARIPTEALMYRAFLPGLGLRLGTEAYLSSNLAGQVLGQPVAAAGGRRFARGCDRVGHCRLLLPAQRAIRAPARRQARAAALVDAREAQARSDRGRRRTRRAAPGGHAGRRARGLGAADQRRRGQPLAHVPDPARRVALRGRRRASELPAADAFAAFAIAFWAGAVFPITGSGLGLVDAMLIAALIEVSSVSDDVPSPRRCCGASSIRSSRCRPAPSR
jgi:hypothetical protein